MIRVAICDDSPMFLSQTKSMIENWNTHLSRNITTELFEDGDSLLAAHSANPFDIVLLDIIMPLLNGIDVAKELRQKDKIVKIVFLTSFTEFAIDSYTVKASNYLLKPIKPDRLLTCLEELVCEIQDAAKCIVVKGVNATHRIPLSDIEYVEAQRKHVMFFLKGNRIIESLDPFYTHENMLMLEDGFFKCHRSYIVNLYCIDNYSHSEIVIRSGHQLPISRSCQKSFENSYFRVIFGKAGDDL